ncbi:MAG TPA: ATP-binding protein [Nocardioides sp.]|uniref:sensor histidine kinase n=1 Tax=Nocardioides sp. TaxID=35761 RepID=UPI002D7E195D|nr:ATP-binding protein [Nocardioides sp.]HET6651032.1 ATP-binding protein [Nocardioides sp.]
MRLLRNPLAQFLGAGILIIVVAMLAVLRLSDTAAQEEAIDDAVATTELLAESVAEPAIPRGLVDGDPGAIDRFDRAVSERLLVGDVQRIKIWNKDGRIVYSDETELINQTFAFGGEELAVLTAGGHDAEQSDLAKPENQFERSSGGLLEVYTRIWSPEGVPLLFEVYYSAEDIEDRKARVFSAFRPITLGGMTALVVAAVPLLWVLTRRLDRTARDRERLLRSAVDASLAERRRIARDLHDTVVQDLAGTAFALSASARDGGAARDELDRMGRSVRSSLRSLRSLLVEILPPNLATSGLHAALEDLVATAANRGVIVEVEADDLEGVDNNTAGLVWRVAQEAVRNTLRHAEAEHLHVRVTTAGPTVLLEVIDDGRGFDPNEAGDRTHFGLRGMESLIHDAGGHLEVTSAPGQGTRVRLQLEAR